uniref:ORF18 n=2 Tax=Human herpesvirus 8 TaxID=37296 RepID=A0A0N9S3E8_HHV8|nr:ORF18 [Human gammaherpesvirus 8]USL87657.1 MAG: ORF18 [Human gammaherpesvirus 8]
MLGKYVCETEPLSPGLRRLMWRFLQNKNLNTFHAQELRFIHLVLCKMYNFGLNVYLLREATANAGTYDEVVLGRKVPAEVWKLVYDGLEEMGMSSEMLLCEAYRDSLWMHLNDKVGLLRGLANYLFHRLGVTHDVRIAPENLVDGNFLFNLGSVLPCRLLLAAGYCLAFWGSDEHERWVRFFAQKLFICYLIVSGRLMPQRSLLVWASETGYPGPVEAVCRDIRSMYGIRTYAVSGYLPAPSEAQLAYLGAFNNNAV